jgi:ligand-binding sensor domain-containing protein
MKYILKYLLLLLAYNASAQTAIPIGTWRTHLNYSQAKTLALAEGRVFVATGHSIFYLDIEEGSINRMTKSDGISEVSVTALGYEYQSGSLFLGSANGNIDIIRGNRVSNINSIANASFVGSKRINGYVFDNGLCYVATDFGIAVVDLAKREIKETYFPGPNGNPLKVSDAVIFNDSIFISTEQGIMAGSLDPQINLIDSRNWKVFGTVDGVPTSSFVSIAIFNNKIYAATSTAIFYYANGKWQSVGLEINEEIRSISASPQQLLIVLRYRILSLSENHSITTTAHALIKNPCHAIIDKAGVFWIADSENGLVTNHKGSFSSLHPLGPSENLICKIRYINGKIIALPKGRDQHGAALGKYSGFFVFEKGQWANYLPIEKPGANKIPAIKDLLDVSFSSTDKKTYFASFGDGLMSWDGKVFEIFDELSSQSTLKTSFISAVHADNLGTIWMLNHSQNPVLHSLQGNTWNSYTTGNALSSLASDFLIYDNGDKWLYSKNGSTGGIIVYNEINNQSRLLSIRNNEGSLPSNSINKLVADRDGNVWAATNNGVAYFSDAQRTLSHGSTAIRPVFEGQRLFFGENVETIAIDGANRQWIGTNHGLWLFDDTGTRLIHHFTAGNSPLLSDEILDIAIDNGSGEVFIATSKGLVSFRGTATVPAQRHHDVVIFPNPVGPGFNGMVGIAGLVENAQVKITDISGKMIWETRSHGGTATWNVADYNGRRAASGVYLVFSSDDNGAETFVGKIAVVN